MRTVEFLGFDFCMYARTESDRARAVAMLIKTDKITRWVQCAGYVSVVLAFLACKTSFAHADVNAEAKAQFVVTLLWFIGSLCAVVGCAEWREFVRESVESLVAEAEGTHNA